MIYLLYLASFIPSVHLRNLLYDTKAVRCYQLNLCLPSYPSLSIICLSSPHHCTPHFVQSFYPLTFAHPIIFFLPFIPLPLPSGSAHPPHFFLSSYHCLPPHFLPSFYPLTAANLPIFGQRPWRGRCPVEQGEKFRTYVRTYVRTSVRPPPQSPRLRGPWA